MGFFYISNPPDEDRDLLNLPEFSLPPPSQHNWSEKPGDDDTDLDQQMERIAELMGEGLVAADLVAGWLCRQVLPLQRRCHRICDMSGRLDPTRISTFQMDLEDVLHRMKMITDLKVDDSFDFGLKPYNRRQPPPVVCSSFQSLACYASSSFC